MRSAEPQLLQGNEACALGAIYAGCDFFAGYPITPSSEIMEFMAREQPKRGGVFIQMEDEIGSISAVIGARWAGRKAMTATSGPGFSLMQEGIGYACITETPCVIVDSQRWGPSTGQPTKTSQGDVMQSRWGTHGDHPVIVLTAAAVREAFEITVRAFNYSELYRVPVIFLMDEVLSHMRENVLLPAPGELDVIEAQRPAEPDGFAPFANGEFLEFGAGARFNVTGMAHDAAGFAVQGAQAERQLRRIIERVESHVDALALYSTHFVDDAERLIVSYGITSRAALRAAELARDRGLKVGLLDLKTLWPFPDRLLRQLCRAKAAVLVPELNLGQLVREVERAAKDLAPVTHLGRADGSLITPEQIVAALQQQQETGDQLARSH